MELRAVSVLKQLGWTTVPEMTGDAVVFRKSGDNELQAILQLRQLPNEKIMTLIISSGLSVYSEIVEKIAGREPRHMWLYQRNILKRKTEFCDTDIEEASNEALAWWVEQDNLSAIKALAAPPPDTGQPQLKHLAALAYLGDFNTLIDYQQIFRKGKRLNFVPMITPEMIDRAVDIAAERA